MSYLSCFFISLSIAAFCASTLPEIRTQGKIMGSHYWLNVLELVCSSFFTLEFLMRLIFCPTKFLFFKRPMNWIDLISILPFYVSYLWSDDKVKMFLVIRVLRLFRCVINKKSNVDYYYSTNSRDGHIWSESHCYPSSLHNRYPAKRCTTTVFLAKRSVSLTMC